MWLIFLSLRDCQFTNERVGLIQEINTPHTGFHDITYEDFTYEDLEKDKVSLNYG